jgi:5-hydroxyisourate hydrolase-like protein (transthyretin family)
MALCLAAEPQQRSVGTSSVTGRVVDAAAGQAIAGASVRLWLVPPSGGFRTQTSETDADGRFRFTGLAAGRFSIEASAETYLRGDLGKRRVLGDAVWIALSDDEHRDDLTIPMFKAAALSGRVVDEHDNPVVGFWVEAWPRVRRPILGDDLPRTASVKTDGNGDYHMTNVVPGDYVVVARVSHDTVRQRPPGRSRCDPPAPPPPPGMPEQPAPVLEVPERPVGTLYSRLPNGVHEPKSLADGRPMTYHTHFFPGVAQMAEAATISVGPGESRAGLDIQLRPVKATTVSGELTSPRGLSGGGEVRLRLAGDPHADTSEAITWLEAGSGAFTLLDVPPGRYYLEPTRYAGPPSCDTLLLDSESKLTRVELDVPPAGVEGLVVPLVEGTSVTGTVVLKGAGKPPDHIDLYLLPLDPSPGAMPPSGEIANRRLTIDGVLPGSYELRASDNATTASWWLESVTVGGHDATGLPLVVGPEGVSDLTVVMTDRPSSIHGTVTTATNRPVVDATVVLFPVDRRTWPNARIRSLRFQTSRALRGVYEFANVPASDYFIAALDETTLDLWPSEAFLQRTEASATRVTVRQGSTQTVRLTIAR